jgi:glycosyltransferase involved in cell wall biosynthesis
VLKILYILEDGRFGGMPKMIADLAAGIRNEGMDTQILVGLKDSDYLLSKINARNVPVKTIALHVLSKTPKAIFLFLFNFLPDIFRLVQAIGKYKPDIVYCNGSQHIKGVIAARLMGKRVTWHMHDTYQPQLILTLFKIIRTVFGLKYFAASCERTISFYNLPIETTLLSRPPVDTQEFQPINHKRENQSFYTVISVANVNPDKGLDTLIRTAAKVNEQRDDVQFLIVGLIPDTQRNLYDVLLALANQLQISNLKFLGQRNDIQTLLSGADVYLCCSNNESGPIAVFEAMAMELPVVATDVGDLRKIFSFHEAGRIQPVKDATALANEIISLLDDSKVREDLGRRGRLTAQQHLDIRHSIANHIHFYASMMR